jgi:hypothetical protein
MRAASLIIIAAFGTASVAFAQTAPTSGSSAYVSSPQSPQMDPVGSNPSRAAKPEQNDADVGDDSLYRGKTGEMETNLIRDDGPLHFKQRPKEKIQEVDSKKLFSSGTDPKFQGSLAISGVSSIDTVAAKANEAQESEEQGDPRFSGKHLTFKPQTDDKPKKAAADSSPSPTPSATASPAAKNSKAQKENSPETR